jgi:hypothetical protein
MQRRLIAMAAALGIVVVVFLAGIAVGSAGIVGVRPATMIGEGRVGDGVVTLWSGGTAYGATSSVAWRDASGAEHEDGWPACLSTIGPVSDLPFTGATVWHDGMGQATILWVDCTGR